MQEVNNHDTLYFENSLYAHSADMNPDQFALLDDCFNVALDMMGGSTKRQAFELKKFDAKRNTEQNPDFKEGLGIGVFMHASHVFGIPERSD